MRDDIIEGFQQGNQRLIAEVVKHYTPKLKAVITPLVGADQAMDVIQEVWLAVVRHSDQFNRKSLFSTWLYRIAVNQAKTHMRKPNLYTEHIPEETASTEGTFDDKGNWRTAPVTWHTLSPEALWSAENFVVHLEAFLHSLPPLQVALLVMHDMEQIDFKEICHTLDITPGNGRVSLFRARKALYRCLEEYQ